jgi:hypothetical protein
MVSGVLIQLGLPVTRNVVVEHKNEHVLALILHRKMAGKIALGKAKRLRHATPNLVQVTML